MKSRSSTLVFGIALVVGSLGLAMGCSSKPKAKPVSAPTTTRPPATTTTVPPGPPAPLTGLAGTADTAKRCAVSVKIGNTAEARPQYGLDQADVVYEEVVDGGITRLVAVFQSQAPDKVGTIRSVRPTDRTIVEPLRGVFAFSGGNPIEVGSINGAPVLQLDEDRAGDKMFRDPGGRAPNNLYARVDRMFGACGDGPPQPLFTYRAPGAAVPGTPAGSVTVGYVAPYGVSWTWDPAQKTWQRSRFGSPDIEAGGKRVEATNVVVMSIPYQPGPAAADGAGIIDGSGPVAVFTAGKVIRGTWSRPDRAKPAQLVAEDGSPIQLTPGTTWVELPDQSYPVTVSP